MLMVGNYFKTQALERTARGLDADGRSFTPYSNKGPYYYYPTKAGVGKQSPSLSETKRINRSLKQASMFPGVMTGSRGDAAVGRDVKRRTEAAQRLFRKLGGKSDARSTAVTRAAFKQRALFPGIKIGGNQFLRTRFGIKFASYAAFKQSLGRSVVDLYGPRAPHMLQALTVRVAEDRKGVILGIYGEAARRARGHQYGNAAKHLPQRRFLGAMPEDRAYAMRLLSAQIRGRMRDAMPHQ
ncbi:hypothetical protein [uncultured Paludibaculum sp.]|uniref:hypothetical protein n=1 Tax=uncultured Paludibaculum sp. TaxID=1765020 RepID=UPI00374CE7AD